MPALTSSSKLSRIQWSAATIFITILLVIFTTEVMVMFLLPYLLPATANPWLENCADGGLLTVISAPLLWWLITHRRQSELEVQHIHSELQDTHQKLEAANAALEVRVAERTAELIHQAFHDPLTGLPNRALFMERLTHALSRATRQETQIAVIFLDLDNFKLVNDSLGHDAGDSLLMAVADCIQSCLQSGDTVARLGGDEFTILLEDIVDTDRVIEIAQQITDSLQVPIVIGLREVFTMASLGIAISDDTTQTPDDLIRNADTAMYQAKAMPKSGHVLFHKRMNASAIERLDLETDLRRALDNHEFRVYYQPILSLENGTVTEMEALVRWQHPKRGLVPPGSFIPLAEETGLIVAIGTWVLREACRQTREWHLANPDQVPLTISVNLSARQLQQSDLVTEVETILRETELSPSYLKLEITESVMIEDAEFNIPKLHALKALGICLAVDDFGTGYSSMAYLSTLPIDTLKVDRSFVSKLGLNEDDDAIVSAIITLAKMLNLKITSEGIETPEQLAKLQSLGCDQGQGFYFARPQSNLDIESLMKQSPKTKVYTETSSADASQLMPVVALPDELGLAA